MPFYIKSNKLNLSKAHKKTNIDKNVIPNHINISTTNKLVGKNASTDRNVYSSQDPYYNGIGRFIRNPNCWLNGISNISCFSPAQLSGASWNTRAGTLITKKHILLARHFPISIISGGTPIIFVDENNNVVRRNIVGYGTLPNLPSGQWPGDYTDIAVAALDSDVPSNIKIAKVLPKNFRDYMRAVVGGQVNGVTTFNFNPWLYSVVLDYEEKAIVKLLSGTYITTTGLQINGNNVWVAIADNYNIESFWVPRNGIFALNQPTAMTPDPAQFHPWCEATIVGDSGNPTFIIIDNELVVTSTFWNPSGGPFVSDSVHYDAINALIENVSPGEGYSLTPVDLAAVYNKYS